jgi:hypothetical protein
MSINMIQNYTNFNSFLNILFYITEFKLQNLMISFHLLENRLLKKNKNTK